MQKIYPTMLDNLKYHVDIYLEIKRMRYWKEVRKTFRIGWSGPNCSLALFQLELHCCSQADKRRVGGVWASSSSSFKGTVGLLLHHHHHHHYLLHHLECLHLEPSLPVSDAGRDSSRLHLRPEMHSLMSVKGRRSQRVLTETG